MVVYEPGDTAPWEEAAFTYILIGINILVFIGTFFLSLGWNEDEALRFYEDYGWVPDNVKDLDLFVKSGYTLLTHMFLHGGIMHILGNMWFLYVFGDDCERGFGRMIYIPFYFAAGLGAVTLHSGVALLFNAGSDIPSIGASGAIFGVVSAYAVLFPDRPLNYWMGAGKAQRVSARTFAMWYIGFEVLMAIIPFIPILSTASGLDNVAHWAHLGGAIVGIVFALIFKKFFPTKYKYMKEGKFGRYYVAVRRAELVAENNT
ncbi:MAG: rhomboid family intramembrane serine protease [Candidatus Hodarchaeota archaeon]